MHLCNIGVPVQADHRVRLERELQALRDEMERKLEEEKQAREAEMERDREWRERTEKDKREREEERERERDYLEKQVAHFEGLFSVFELVAQHPAQEAERAALQTQVDHYRTLLAKFVERDILRGGSGDVPGVEESRVSGEWSERARARARAERRLADLGSLGLDECEQVRGQQGDNVRGGLLETVTETLDRGRPAQRRGGRLQRGRRSVEGRAAMTRDRARNENQSFSIRRQKGEEEWEERKRRSGDWRLNRNAKEFNTSRDSRESRGSSLAPDELLPSLPGEQLPSSARQSQSVSASKSHWEQSTISRSDWGCGRKTKGLVGKDEGTARNTEVITDTQDEVTTDTQVGEHADVAEDHALVPHEAFANEVSLSPSKDKMERRMLGNGVLFGSTK